MDSNSLMIGDWVYLNIDEGEKLSCKVREILAHRLIVSNLKGAVWSNEDTEKWFTPIPLTAEILEKNAYPDDGSWYCFGDFYVAHYGECYVIHQNPNDDKREFLCRINYVHELQHALRLCGLNDLADNFKI